MTRFFDFSLVPDNPDTFEYSFEFREKYSDSLADKSSFRPVAESINGLNSIRGAVEDGVFHFPDGSDDGRSLDSVPRRGEDIAVLYQRARELETELNAQVSEANRLKSIRDKLAADNSSAPVAPAQPSAPTE